MANEFIARKGLISNVNAVVSGSVGIGTASTGNNKLKLFDSAWHIPLGIETSSTIGVFLALNSVDTGIDWTIGHLGSLVTGRVGHLEFTDGSAVENIRMTIENGTGNVGIGTIAPNSALSVIGTISGSSNIIADGNVGIGTSSPGNKLHVQQSSTGQSPDNVADALVLEQNGGTGMTILSATNDFGAIHFGDSGDNDIGRILYNHSTDGMSFWTNNAQQITIDSSGNVGIGITNPVAALSLASDKQLNIGGHTSKSLYTGYENIQLDERTFLSSADTVAFFSQNVYLDTSGNWTRVVEDDAVMIRMNNSTGDIRFITDTSAAVGTYTPSERMRIDSSGNVGIGTTSPNRKLYVNGSSHFSDYMEMTADLYVYSGGKIRLDSAGGAQIYGEVSGADTHIVLTPRGSGNVGIGTTSPDSLLHLFSTTNDVDDPKLILESDEAAGSYPAILFKSSEGSAQYEVGKIYSGFIGGGGWANTRTTLAVPNSGGSMTDTLTLALGNVGIGTTSPEGIFHVKGTPIYFDSAAATTLTIGTRYNGSNRLQLLSRTDDGTIHIDNSKDMRFTTYDGGIVEAIRIKNTGNVGIGSTSPAEKLDIDQGNIHMDDSPTSDHEATGGVVVTTSVSGNATGFGAALHMDTTGGYVEADASGTTTMPCHALALETGTGSKKILMQGFVRDDTWAWTVGGTIYVSTTTGALTQTTPSTTGDQVQAVGFATHADRFYFSPDYTMIEIA